MMWLQGLALAHASEVHFLGRLWLVRLLPILALSIAVDLTGLVWLMSLVGTLCLSSLFQTYRRHKKMLGLLHRAESDAKPVDWMILASIAVVAQLTTDLHLKVGTDPMRATVWTTLGQGSAFWDVVTVVLLALLTVVTGYALKVWRQGIEKAFKGMATFEFIQNVSTLVCGIWGATALTAAVGTLQVPVDSWLQQESIGGFAAAVSDSVRHERESALALYGELNQYFLFGTFLVAPLAWLVIDVPRWLSIDSSERPHVWGRGWITCAALVLAVGSAAVVTGVIWRYPTIAVLGAFGDPRDRAMARCLVPARDSAAELACLQPWESGWQAEMDELIKSVLPQVSPRVRDRFQAGQASFEREFVSGVQPRSDTPYEQFSAVFARGTNIRTRTRDLRKAMAGE